MTMSLKLRLKKTRRDAADLYLCRHAGQRRLRPQTPREAGKQRGKPGPSCFFFEVADCFDGQFQPDFPIPNVCCRLDLPRIEDLLRACSSLRTLDPGDHALDLTLEIR